MSNHIKTNKDLVNYNGNFAILQKMNKQLLKDTIQQLFTNNKGLLAMDEGNGTCNKRFAASGIPQTIEMRRKYREMIVTTPGLNESIGGAILYDETSLYRVFRNKNECTCVSRSRIY